MKRSVGIILIAVIVMVAGSVTTSLGNTEPADDSAVISDQMTDDSQIDSGDVMMDDDAVEYGGDDYYEEQPEQGDSSVYGEESEGNPAEIQEDDGEE